MKIKNEVQARERLKYVLDGYMQAHKLLHRGFVIDCEDDSDIAEWTNDEMENGNGYLEICSIELIGSSFDQPKIHLNTVGYVSNLLKLPVDIEERSDGYPYEISVNYKGYRFFDLYTTEEYEAEKHLFYKGDTAIDKIGVGV